MRKLTRTALLCIMLATAAVQATAQKWENLAETPQMGWNSWNKFQGNISEEVIKGIADAMVEEGLLEAGYTYLNIDDCWHGKRDADGFIQVDAKKFPSGMKALADYVHSKGLKMGIYSDAGTETCGGYPGSLGHEYQDAIQYSRWGIDYLKYDWCNTPNINPQGAYTLISDALRAAGRPILLSMCEWGNSHPWKWARDVGHSWRTTPDIWCDFDSLRQYAGPGHWNDPDMLEVGNGMTENEDRAHFTMWCMMASPLILGNDLRNMSDATRRIILNKEMIAIDQDPLGVQGLHYCDLDGLSFWFKPLKNGDWAFTILNPTRSDVTVELNWQDFNFTDTDVSGKSTSFDNIIYKVYNLWTHKTEGKTSKKNKVDRKLTVKSRDVVSFRLIKS